MNENGSDERKALHDIAGPLGTAMFVLDFCIETFKERPNYDTEHLEQLTKIATALEKAKQTLNERREVLIKRGVPGSQSGKFRS